MSYCRFENTARDLDDCADHILDFISTDAYDSENRARIEMINTMIDALEQLGCEVNTNGMTAQAMLEEYGDRESNHERGE